MPHLSTYFSAKQPSAIRMAQMQFAKRTDEVDAINVSVGNVSLPMHPALQKRLFEISWSNTPLAQGIVQYTQTVGLEETNKAFLHIIASSGCPTMSLYSQITDGGTQAMELVLLWVADANDKPILLIDPAYTNYLSLAQRTSRKTISLCRTLQEDGKFSLPTEREIDQLVQEYHPSALIIIPYDNPTGQLMSRDDLLMMARLCVRHNMRLISDEAYRELYYTQGAPLSVRSLNDEIVPGIQGRRISIETASKVWNACGLRIWALITDNKEFHEQCVAENTTCLCSSTIGQYVFGALAHESFEDLHARYNKQRSYYGTMLQSVSTEIKKLLPGVIVSRPDAALYSIIDVRNIAKPGFNAKDFSLYCAEKWGVELNGEKYTLLVSPMSGFYRTVEGVDNPGLTQMRIALVETPERMQLVPQLFVALFKKFEEER